MSASDSASDSEQWDTESSTSSCDDFSKFRIAEDFSFRCPCGETYVLNDGNMECSGCGNITENHYSEQVTKMTKKSEGFTHDQKKSLLRKLDRLNKEAKLRDIRPFSEEVLQTTVEYFARLREATQETRSQKLGSRIAACLYFAARDLECGRQRKEISRFCKISSKISAGIDLINMLELQGYKITAGNILDPRRSFANTIFIRCDIRNKKDREKLCDVVCYILRVTEEEHLISVSSMHDSKVAAASYIAMRLCRIPENMDLDVVSKICKVHADTLLKFINEVKRNIHLFSFDWALDPKGTALVPGT